MCQKCLDALDTYFLLSSEEEREFVLFAMTSFPFGTPEDIAKQIEEAYWGKVHSRKFVELEGWKE